MLLFIERNRAYRGFARTLRADARDYIDVDGLFNDIRDSIYRLISSTNSLRVRLIICICILFEKFSGSDISETKSFFFCSKAERILSVFMIHAKIDSAFRKIRESIDTFIRNGSGWNIKQIEFVDVHIGRYRALRGGCSEKRAQLPIELKNKKSLLNIRCRDDLCFLYCVAASLNRIKAKTHRYTKYKRFLKYFNTQGISFPIKLSDISNFEKKNQLNIYVYGYENKEVFPIHRSSIEKSKKYNEIDLFLYDHHYYLITNLSKFLYSKKGIYHHCRNCLNGFQRKSTLEKHRTLCEMQQPQKLTIPKKLSLKFDAYPKMLYHPFTAYADFECVTKKISSALPNTNSSFICEIEKHEAASYSLIVLDMNDSIIFHEMYIGPDAASRFLKTLKNVSYKVIEELHKIIPMDTNLNTIYDESKCHICQKDFLPGQIKTRDHDHRNGKILGLAHQSCNLNRRTTYNLPLVLHNCKNYDSHLILKNIPKNYVDNVYIIPVNIEKFTMFWLDSIKIIDSYQFLDASLESLVENLKKSKHDFRIFNQFFDGEPNKNLLLGKGIFPYSYFDSLSVLEEKAFPPKNAFCNVLNNYDISESEYQHALTVYRAFNCKTFSDYVQIYNNTDVLLLAEIFTSFRRTAMNYYKLDPVHFVTSADLTWNAGLKLCKVELQLFNNVNDYIWLESQMRGGICFLGKRHAIANNPYIPEAYDNAIDNSYILALDANNLYGKVMEQSLPYGHFRYLTRDEIQSFDILKTTCNSRCGYFLEVDFEYPVELHDIHDDLPMAVEHLNITYDMLSPQAKLLCDSMNLKHTLPCKKLTPNFFCKKNYISHYLNVKFYVEHGLRITKIHKILSFSQKPWLRSYITFNNDKRTQATSDFEKNFFKKMNNSFFGKTCQNIRKRQNIFMSLNEKQYNKYMSSPTLEYFDVINDYTTLFKCKKINLFVDKPIYVGFTVLELSKLHMYSLYYENFKKCYNSNCTLLYMDTDSLYMHIKTKDVYKDLKYHFSDIMDFSNYNQNDELYDSTNKGKLGSLKSETCLPVKEFVGLKCKMYSLSFGNETKMKAKGVKKTSLKKNITVDTYRNVLENDSLVRHTQHSIVSKKHTLYTIVQNKISLSSFYDKKYLLNNSVDTRSYGHYLNAYDNFDNVEKEEKN